MRGRNTPQISVQLSDEMFELLEQRAHLSDLSVNALVQRYVEDGIRQEAHPEIVMRAGAGGRTAALAGTRLYVWQVVATVRDNDWVVEHAAEYLSLRYAQVSACLDYCCDKYQSEVLQDERLASAYAAAEQSAFEQKSGTGRA